MILSQLRLPFRHFGVGEGYSTLEGVNPHELLKRLFTSFAGSQRRSPLPSKPKRVLVAGFDAFDNLDANPSQIIVETLDSSIKLPGRKGEVLLDPIVLPTCCNKAWSKLKRKMDANKGAYDAVILTGVAAKRMKISLERFALNIRDYRIKDNGGHQYVDQLIEKGAPDAVKTALSIAAISKTLAKSGVLCEVSNHAGTFICNEVYFKCLRYQEKQRHSAQVLFVHLPLPNTYARLYRAHEPNRPTNREPGIALMRAAVEQIIVKSV